MLKIKLARFGKKNQPHYRIVVNEARDKRDGSYVEALGHYAPSQEPKILKIDLKAYQEWLAKGAQPTDTVAALVEKFKSGKPFPPKKKELSKKAKAKAEEAAKEAAAPKEEVEKPAVEVEAVPEEAAEETADKPEETPAPEAEADKKE